MNITPFLEQLWNSGRVVVRESDEGEPDDLEEATERLKQLEPAWRDTLASTAPEVDWPAAIWALQQVHQAARWIALRTYDVTTLQAARDSLPTQTITPSVIYSVDLTMRFLPDLVRLGQTPADDDPLPPKLLQWARAWPLSSVGIPCQGSLHERQVSVILSHESLKLLYIDRIIHREDTQRLDDARVADAVREAMGLHTSLSPALYAALHGEEGDTPR